MNLKKELRLTLRAQRDGIEADKRRAFSELICKSCLSLPEYTSAKVVLLYFPTGSEADLSLLAEDALQSGKTVAYPRVEGKGMMTFFSITSLSMLEKGYFGIMEPKKEA
ncbi:MAG: hypothetical protein IKL24_07165, partial [Clostridia bacterium]|nr:hypothetical protein [Clostridia bacterium]